MELRIGTKVRSAVCSTEVIVVKAPKQTIDLRCGGAVMLASEEEPPAGAVLAAGHNGGTQLGKRYVSEVVGLEVLCTKPGDGSLSLGDEPLEMQGARPLPPSD